MPLHSAMPSIAAVLVLAAAVPATAQGVATPWIDGYNSKTRLIAATMAAPKPMVNAGIEITMAPGWKTYWRTPGDAGGVPPNLDWAASSNVAAVKMLFPAPGRLETAHRPIRGQRRGRGIQSRFQQTGTLRISTA